MKVSQHAIKRMNERGIAPQEIVDVITRMVYVDWSTSMIQQ